MDAPAPVTASAGKRALLLEALGGKKGPDSQGAAHGTVPWPESLYDRVVRMRIEVSSIFEKATADLYPQQAAENVGASSSIARSALSVVEADILRCLQRLAETLPRALYQETINASMRSEFEDHQRTLLSQQQQLLHQQQQLYNARRIHQHAAPGEAIGGNDCTGSPLVVSSPSSTAPSSPFRSSAHHPRPGHTRPASAGRPSMPEETFNDAHVRHLYTQLHDARAQLQGELRRVEALKAFCLRKDAAVDYIRETLLQEVVALKEQIRRQEHDPNFISEFVTLFDCWKVLEGDEPGGGAGGSDEAVRHAKKELQAESARIQHQLQMSLRKKEDEVAELQRQLQAQAGTSPSEKKKSTKGKGKDDFHEQFLQLTTDMAKKDVQIADMTEEIKQMQTEVAIAQQLAKSTRDQLNRSALDVEDAVGVRDMEIATKTELIASLEVENAQLRAALTDDALKQSKLDLISSNAATAVALEKLESVEVEREHLALENIRLNKLTLQMETEITHLREVSQMGTDEKVRALLQQITELQGAVAAEHVLVEHAEKKLHALETELDKVSSNYETVKFEHTKLRSALRGGKGQESAPPTQLPSEAAEDMDLGVPIDVVGPTEEMFDDRDSGAVTPAVITTTEVGGAVEEVSGATEALERRLAKEMGIKKRLKIENESLAEELDAVRHELRSLLEERAGATDHTLSASNATTRSPARRDGKSPRRRSGSGAKRPGTTAEGATADDASGLRLQLKEKTLRIGQLENELEVLRTQRCTDAASALVQRPAATFAYHVSPTEKDATNIPQTDIPNICIEAAKSGPAADANLSRLRRDAPGVKGGLAQEGAQQKARREVEQAPTVTASRKSSSRGGGPRHGSTDQRLDHEVSPFTATLANIQEMDGMDIGGGSSWIGDGDLPPARDSSPPVSDIASVSEEVYHRALHGGGGISNHGDDGPEGYSSGPRVAVLEASLLDKDQDLRRVVLHSATLAEEVSALRQQVSTQQEEIQHLRRAANAPVVPSSLLPHGAMMSRGVSPMSPVDQSPLLDDHYGPPRVSQVPLAHAVGLPSSNPTPDRQGGASPVMEGPRLSSPIGTIVVSIPAAVQTDLTLASLASLFSKVDAVNHAAARGESTATTTLARGTPPLSAGPSRQGSANQRHRSAVDLPSHVADLSDDEEMLASPNAAPVQRLFSAHRRAVHTAGSSVSVQQKSSRVLTETQFYLTGDGIHGSGAPEDPDEDDSHLKNSSLPSGRVLRSASQPRPLGSASSQRGGTVGEKLNSAVAVAKGLSDRNKSSMTRQHAGNGEEAHSRNEASTLQDLVARPSSSLGRKQQSSILQQVQRPLAPAVLNGSLDGLQSMAKAQLAQHAWRMSPVPGPADSLSPLGLSGDPLASGQEIQISAPQRSPDHKEELQTHSASLPNTVDHREHISQVILGGGSENAAIRGVKGKIKHNVNVEKFMSKVLTVRR